MNRNFLKIRIKRRTECEKIILGIFIIICLEGFLSIFIPQAHVLYYLVDVLNIILILEWLYSKKIGRLFNKPTQAFMICFSLFLLFAAMGMLVNYSNILLHIWGCRRVFSNLFFFIACICFQKTQDLKIIDILFWLNFVVSCIEILLGYRQDWVGGIYGVSGGQVNGPLNILLVIVTVKAVIEYINKEESVKKLSIYILLSLLIAAFAELKIYFMELIVIVALCSLVTRFSYKKLFIFIVGAVAAFLGVTMLSYVFPEFSMDVLSVKYIWNYLTNPGGYVGQFAYDAGDVNRLAFWNKCIVYLNGFFEKLFGLGIGNCDTIDLIGVQSAFYKQHNALHYYMFPLPMFLLEQGISGMFLYLAIFLFIFIALSHMQNRYKCVSSSIFQIAKVLCLMAFVITIYDSSLLGKGGFIFFYILALPFVGITDRNRSKI